MNPIAQSSWMAFPFGKKESIKDQPIERIVLASPDFVGWLLGTARSPYYSWAYEAVERFIDIFDRRPFSVACYGSRDGARCPHPVTKMSFCGSGPTIYFWCEGCQPSQSGVDGHFWVVRSYREALRYVADFCGGLRGVQRQVIRLIYIAKGLTGPLNKRNVLAFFDERGF